MTDIAPDERTDFKGQMSIFWDELRAMLATIDALTTENAKLRTSFAAAAGREGGR